MLAHRTLRKSFLYMCLCKLILYKFPYFALQAEGKNVGLLFTFHPREISPSKMLISCQFKQEENVQILYMCFLSDTYSRV